jgi:prepilin-type N-terminal cleavage/methylation domain-containing protein
MIASKNKRGFSLAEILVAIAIVAVIAAVVVPSIGSQLKSGDESRVQQDLTAIRAATEQFLADVRRYPKSLGQLITQPESPTSDTSLVAGVFSTSQMNRWKGPYLNKDSATAVRTGFDASIDALFTSVAWSGQNYLTVSLPAVDTGFARALDRRMDDGTETTGSIQYTLGVPTTTTIRYFVLPIQ